MAVLKHLPLRIVVGSEWGTILMRAQCLVESVDPVNTTYTYLYFWGFMCPVATAWDAFITTSHSPLRLSFHSNNCYSSSLSAHTIYYLLFKIATILSCLLTKHFLPILLGMMVLIK